MTKIIQQSGNQSHYYYTFIGNKWKEIKKFEQYLCINEDTIFIEPFAGSAAVSYYLWKRNKCKNININDRDPLIWELWNIMRDDNKRIDKINEINKIVDNITTKEEYNRIVKIKSKHETLNNRIIASTWYHYRPGIYPIDKKKPEYIKVLNIPYNDFLKSENVKQTCEDFRVICDKHKDNPNAFIFLDPPYVNEDNCFYFNDGATYDMESLYQYMHDLMKSNAKILMIVSDTLLSRLLYRDYIRGSYDKNYSLSKKKTRHLIISNIII